MSGNNGSLGTFKIDGKDIKIVNAVTMLEIEVLKLEDGREISRLKAQEEMMTGHKRYMVRLLTDAINIVMRAVKTDKKVKLVDGKGLGFLRRKLKI